MIREIVKWVVFKCIYPCWYWLSAGRPVDRNKVIFVENHQTYLTDNFLLIYQELEREGYELHVHYLQVAHSGWGAIIRRSLQLIQDMATASIVFLNESNSLFGTFTLRKDTQLVQLWHACGAFKKWGFSVADKEFGDNAKELTRYSGHKNYTLVPVSGSDVCFAYEEAFGLQGRNGIVKPLGVSRTDVFFDPDYRKQAYQHLYEWKPEWKDKKIILYLPTFRGTIKKAKAPDQLDWRQMSALDDSYVFVVQNHPFVTENMLIPEELSDRFLDVTGKVQPEMTTEEWMMVSDVCITDYSSVVFEYSLLEKPIVFFAYDLASYYDERGFYFPYEAFVPGPIVRNTEELIEQITHVDEFDYGRLRSFKDRYMNGCDGMSTKRILETIFRTAECKKTGGSSNGRK